MRNPGSSAVVDATRHMAMLARLGYGPSEGLKSAAHAASWLSPVAHAVERGDSAARAASRQPRLFSPLYVSMLGAAEASPRPAELLGALSRLLERADRLREQLFSALVYPLILLNVILLQLIFFAKFILPGTALPLARALAERGDARVAGVLDLLLSTHLLSYLGALALVLLNVAAFGGGDVTEPLAARLPFAAPLRALADQALWLRALGCLLEAGLPLPRALREAATVAQVRSVRTAVRGLADRVERGQPLSRALQVQRGLDPLLAWAAEAGEEREDMGPVFLEAAAALDSRVDLQCGLAVRLAQPWALAFAGAVVVSVLMIFWGPFFSLTGGFQ